MLTPDACAAPGPLISVIMPAYNAARFIEEAVRSVCAQTYPHWELLVINDRSTDDTVARVQRLMEQDSRIRILETTGLRKPSAVRNLGLKEAKGQFIGFLDADDAYYPETLSRLMAVFETQPALNLCFGFPEYMDEASGHIENSIYLTAAETGTGFRFSDRFSWDWPSIYLCKTTLTVSSMLARADALLKTGGFDEQMTTSEDYKFFVGVFRQGLDKVAVIPEPVYRFRRNQGSLTSQFDAAGVQKVFEDTTALLDWMYALPEATPEIQALKPEAYRVHYDSFARQLIKQGNPAMARRMLRQVRRNPNISLGLWMKAFPKLYLASYIPQGLMNRALAAKRSRRNSPSASSLLPSLS